MAHRDRTIRKKRGSRTVGYGNAQKHRGAGSRGGRGMAGSKKHKWMWVSKHMPDHIGRSGFKRHRCLSSKSKTINVSELEDMMGSWLSEEKAEMKGKKIEVDLKNLGFDKLLGTGKISKAVSVTVDACSRRAREKIEAAGGSITLLSPKEEIESKEDEIVDESRVSEAGDQISAGGDAT